MRHLANWLEGHPTLHGKPLLRYEPSSGESGHELAATAKRDFAPRRFFDAEVEARCDGPESGLHDLWRVRYLPLVTKLESRHGVRKYSRSFLR